jgi:flagellar protein FliL
MSQPAAATDASAKPGRNRLVLIAVVAVVLLGGGGAAFWFLGPSSAAEAQEAHEPEPAGKPGIVALDPFVVNLADAGGTRFLRLTLKLVVQSEEHAKELSEDEVARSRVRSTMIELLTLQTGERLVTPEGKAELKTQIAERAGHAMHDTKVLDVLFSEFVVQF